MNLVITEKVFNADDQTLRMLDQITDRVEDGIHRLEIVGADRLKESRFFKRLDLRGRNFCLPWLRGRPLTVRQEKLI